MLDEKDLQAIAQLVRAEIAPINSRLDGIDRRLDGMDKRLDKLQEDVTEFKEAHEETRSGVNALLEWSDNVSVARDFPLPKI